MARINIKDLPKEMELSETEFRSIFGGMTSHTLNLPIYPPRTEDKIRGFFQEWQEKANQVDQQLTSVLRVMKDLGRVGVGGSDLGAS